MIQDFISVCQSNESENSKFKSSIMKKIDGLDSEVFIYLYVSLVPNQFVDDRLQTDRENC